MTPIEERLGAELHRLTDGLTASADPRGDVRRGRRRRTRVRLTVACASVLVAACAAAVGALTSGEERAPVAKDPAPAATHSVAPEPAAPSAGRPSRCVDPDAGGPGANGRITALAPDLLDGYRAILVGHLDPAERHLGRGRTNEQAGTAEDPACPAGRARLTSYGTKLDWRIPGESGLGMVQVEVTEGPWQDAQMRLGHDTWQQRPLDLPGVVSAEVATHDGGVAVVVHRADGVSVGIDANALFGNNSRTPVSGVGLSVEQLLAAAADPDFTLS